MELQRHLLSLSSGQQGLSSPLQELLTSRVMERKPGSTMDRTRLSSGLPPGSRLSVSSLCCPLPGYNISRSCTEEGWSQLEPGPYHIACGLNDRASSLDEVRGSCASVNPGVRPPPVHISQDPTPGSSNRVHTGLFMWVTPKGG